MSTVLNVTTAPRDRELLIKANRFTLRILAEQLKLYDPANTTQRNAWLKYTIEEQAERVLAALLKLDKKGGKSSEPERTPVHKKGKKAPPPDEDEEEEEEEEEDEKEDGEEVDEDEEKPPVRKPTKGKPAKKDEEDAEDEEEDEEEEEEEDEEEEEEEDEEEEPARKPVKGKTAERSPVNKGAPARTPAKPATAAAPGKPAEALLEALEEIKQRLDMIEEQFRISHSFQGLAISMLSAVGGSVLDETALYEASLEGFDKATQRIKDVQVATKKTRKAPKGK